MEEVENVEEVEKLKSIIFFVCKKNINTVNTSIKVEKEERRKVEKLKSSLLEMRWR